MRCLSSSLCSALHENRIDYEPTLWNFTPSKGQQIKQVRRRHGSMSSLSSIRSISRALTPTSRVNLLSKETMLKELTGRRLGRSGRMHRCL